MRVCIKCNSNKTLIHKDGWEYWYKIFKDSKLVGYQCKYCYNKQIQRKKAKIKRINKRIERGMNSIFHTKKYTKKQLGPRKCVECNIRNISNGNFDTCRVCINKQKNRICRLCDNVATDLLLCEKCRDRLRNTPLKVKVFDILGWECVCCELDVFLNLTIDHIDPNKKTSKHKSNPRYLYKEIIDNPEEAKKMYQVLCHVCNVSKSRGDKCTLDHECFSSRDDIIEYLESLNVYI